MHVQRGDNNCKHQSIILLKANAKRILCTGVSKGQMVFLKLTARTMCMPIGLAYFLNLLCKSTKKSFLKVLNVLNDVSLDRIVN